MSFLSNLTWRYATKKFDATKHVSEENVEKILEAMRYTPTAFGLQPYHFYVVTNQEVKDKIQAASYHQPQVGTSSHLIAITARTDVKNVKEEFFEVLSGGDKEVRATMLKGYEDMVDGYLANFTNEKDILAWTMHQTHLAQAFGMAAATELQIDSCPMEGFDPKAVGEILGVPTNERVALLLPIGYRAREENPRPKARFSKEALFTFVK